MLHTRQYQNINGIFFNTKNRIVEFIKSFIYISIEGNALHDNHSH